MARGKKGPGLRFEPETAVTRAGEAVSLGTTHQAALVDRWPPALLENLARDAAALNENLPEKITRRTSQKADTKTVRLTEKTGANEVGVVREALSGLKAPADLQKAAGVGTRVQVGTTKTVLSAMDSLVATGTGNADAFAAVGVLPRDLEAIARRRTEVASADTTQEANKLTRKLSTKEVGALQAKVEEAIARVSHAGQIHFTLHDSRPTLVGQFAALLAKGAGSAPAATTTTGDPGGGE